MYAVEWFFVLEGGKGGRVGYLVDYGFFPPCGLGEVGWCHWVGCVGDSIIYVSCYVCRLEGRKCWKGQSVMLWFSIIPGSNQELGLCGELEHLALARPASPFLHFMS